MPSTRTRRGASRGAPMLRLRIGFVLIAIVLSFFGARLVQLQGVDPRSYAVRAAAEGAVRLPLVAERGDILDRNGVPLADSVKGKMVIADPDLTADRAPELARLLSDRLPSTTSGPSRALRGRKEGSRYEYVARRVPSTLAGDTLAELDDAGFTGHQPPGRPDPLTTPPATWPPTCSATWAPTSRSAASSAPSTSSWPATDGEARWHPAPARASGSRWARTARGRAQRRGAAHHDRPRPAVVHPEVLPSRSAVPRGERRAAVSWTPAPARSSRWPTCPTFDANAPTEADEDDLGSRALSDTYEPGSVEKVLTAASLIDAGKAFPRQQLQGARPAARQDRPIGDWFDHGNIRLTLAGIIAKSSNIGTVLAADAFTPQELVAYLQQLRPRPADRRRRPRRVARHPHAGEADDLADQGPRRLRPVALGQRRPDGRGRQHGRQRRRARLARA